MPDETKVIEQPHSCKIAINAKGMFSGEVKCYADSPGEAWFRATAQADALLEYIKEKNGLSKPEVK